MYNEVERGVCDVCGKEGDLVRTYFYYPIDCTCHSPVHFELMSHHKECVPKEPKYTKVELRTEDLKDPSMLASKIIKSEMGLVSDGYHTFDELYFHISSNIKVPPSILILLKNDVVFRAMPYIQR